MKKEENKKIMKKLKEDEKNICDLPNSKSDR